MCVCVRVFVCGCVHAGLVAAGSLQLTPLTLFRCVRSCALRRALRSAEPSLGETTIRSACVRVCVAREGFPRGPACWFGTGGGSLRGLASCLSGSCRKVSRRASFPLRSAGWKTPRGTVADPFWVPFKDPDADPAGGGVV